MTNKSKKSSKRCEGCECCSDTRSCNVSTARSRKSKMETASETNTCGKSTRACSSATKSCGHCSKSSKKSR